MNHPHGHMPEACTKKPVKLPGLMIGAVKGEGGDRDDALRFSTW